MPASLEGRSELSSLLADLTFFRGGPVDGSLLVGHRGALADFHSVSAGDHLWVFDT